MENKVIYQFSSVQSLSHVRLFVTPWTVGGQTSLSITNSQGLLMSIESVVLSNRLILCHPLLFLPSMFPSTRVFSNESVLRIRWPKLGSFSFSISPGKNFPGKSIGVGYHFLLQGIFLTQESNPGLSHCRQMLYPLSHQGSLQYYETRYQLQEKKL